MKIMNCGLIFPAEGSKQYFSHFFDCFAFYSISLNVLRPCGMQQIAHCHALRLQIPSTGVIECVSGLLLVEIKKNRFCMKLRVSEGNCIFMYFAGVQKQL